MYQTSDIRKGLKIEMDGAPWMVVEFQFVKPGKGTAFTRTKLKNLLTGNVVDRSFRTGESLQPADVELKNMAYSYNDGENYVFMDTSTYEQAYIAEDVLGSSKDWLKEEMECEVMFYKGRAVGVEVPNFVILRITYCEPGVRGNTAQGATKPATVETGATVKVPLFVEEGTLIKIDTRTGDYLERVAE